MTKEIKTEIDIDSSIDVIWNVISDFHRYNLWNPFITKIEGKLELDNKIKIVIKTASGKVRNYNPIITKVEPPHELRWKGQLFSSSIFSGERIFIIKEINNNKAKFLNCEKFTGIGSYLTPKKMEHDILKSFELMNRSLKKYVEENKTL